MAAGSPPAPLDDLECITSHPARVGSITADLVYEVVVDRSIPVPPVG